MKPVISELEKPEQFPVPGRPGVFETLTHSCVQIKVDPRDEIHSVLVVTQKGFMVDGKFQDYGPSERDSLDAKGYAALVEKSGGDFKISDIPPALTARLIEKEAAEVARTEAEEKAEAARVQAAKETPEAVEADRQTRKAAAKRPEEADTTIPDEDELK